MPADARATRAPWRMALVQAVQVAALAYAVASGSAAALLPAALIGGTAALLGTDSGWRRGNRVLLLQAAGWGLAALAAGCLLLVD